MYLKEYVTVLVLVLGCAALPTTLALTTVNITTPTNNTVTTGTIPINATTDANASNVTFTVINASNTVVNTSINTTATINFSTQLNTTQLADGNYTINATARNATTTVTNQTLIFIDNTKPVINDVTVAEQDTFYSTIAKDTVHLQVNVTDPGPANIRNVQANLSRFPGGSSNALTYNTTTGLYETSYTPTQNTFETNVTPVTTVDNVSQTRLNNTFTITLHNLTRPRGPPTNPCFRFGNGTTNFSQEPNFADINFIMHAELNGSCTRLSPTPPWTGFNRIGTLNFTSLNFTKPSTARKLSGIGQNINVDPKLPSSFGNSRIFVNTTYLASLNTNSTLTLYDLPFRQKPNIVGDNTSKLANVTWKQGGYNANFGSKIGNLTFEVTGFSEYNATDTTKPVITPNTPTASANITNASITYNVTFNGTGTGISNKTVIIDSTKYTASNLTCNNITQGSDTQHCTVNITLSAGEHTVNATAYDYGGSNPGNTNTTLYNFTVTGQITGNESAIQGNKQSLNVTIAGNTNLTKSYTGNKTVNITNNGQTSVTFTKDFTHSNLNLSVINITEKTLSGDNSMTINGLSLQSHTKTIYMNQSDTSKNGVCILDQANVSASSITTDCSGTNEVSLQCTSSGKTTGQYTCTDLGSRLKIEGLNHSAVRQYNVNTGSNNDGSTGGGGGGGGGGTVLKQTGKTFDFVQAGTSKQFFVDNSQVPVNSIEFTPVENLTDVTVSVKPTAETAPGIVISQFNILSSFTDDQIASAKIDILLEEQAIQNISPTNVTVYRDGPNGWEALPTTVEDTYAGYEYTAETPGFSSFAIGQIQLSTDTTNENNQTRNQTNNVQNSTDTTDQTAQQTQNTQAIDQNDSNTKTNQRQNKTSNTSTTPQNETPTVQTKDKAGFFTHPLTITALVILLTLIAIYFIYTNKFDLE